MTDAPMTQRDVEALRTTLDKLDRTIDSLRGEISSTYVRKDVIEPTLRDMQKDIDAHSDWLTWAQRIVIGTVFLALLGVVISQGGWSG